MVVCTAMQTAAFSEFQRSGSPVPEFGILGEVVATGQRMDRRKSDPDGNSSPTRRGSSESALNRSPFTYRLQR